MRAKSNTILVHPITRPRDFGQRQAERFSCRLDATVNTSDSLTTLAWGALVRDISHNGVGLTLCFPFPTGTCLALDLKASSSHKTPISVLTRVIHSRDKNNGSWNVGCEFIKSLTK